MGKIYPYKISKAHENNVRASGFDIRDPDKRYKVASNRVKQAVLAYQNKEQHTRMQLLLADRVKAGKELVRSFFVISLVLLLMSGDEALAYNPDREEINLIQTEVELGLDESLFGRLQLPEVTLMDFAISELHWQLGLLGLLSILAILSLGVQISIRNALGSGKEKVVKRPDAPEAGSEIKADCPEIQASETHPEPSPFHWYLDGATRKGKIREENQDAFGLGSSQKAKTGFVLCDGAGGHEGGREASAKAVEILLPFLDPASEPLNSIAPLENLLAAINHAQQLAYDEDRQGITTAILVQFNEDWMHYASLGDGALAVVWPDGMISQHLVPHHVRGYPSNQIAGFIGRDCEAPPRVGSIRLEPGCMVLAMSDGASDLFNDDHFADHRTGYQSCLKDPEDWVTDRLLRQIENARNEKTGAWLHHDNMTLVAAVLDKEAEQ